MSLARWTDSTLRALFDPSCAACRGPVGPGRVGPVCLSCWSAIRIVSPPWCDRCGEPLQSWRHTPGSDGQCARCAVHAPQFDLARAFGLYEGALREIVHALKYRGHRSLGGPLGALMKKTDRQLLAGVDAVVPVPLHPWRHLLRGFNQADELAQALERPVWRPLLRRTLGVPQAGLSGHQRRTNVRTAYCFFRLRAGAPARQPTYVVLIDDVMTTGATIDACSRVLREAGVKWIGALTLARAVTTVSGGATPLPPPPRALHSSAVRR